MDGSKELPTGSSPSAGTAGGSSGSAAEKPAAATVTERLRAAGAVYESAVLEIKSSIQREKYAAERALEEKERGLLAEAKESVKAERASIMKDSSGVCGFCGASFGVASEGEPAAAAAAAVTAAAATAVTAAAATAAAATAATATATAAAAAATAAAERGAEYAALCIDCSTSFCRRCLGAVAASEMTCNEKYCKPVMNIVCNACVEKRKPRFFQFDYCREDCGFLCPQHTKTEDCCVCGECQVCDFPDRKCELGKCGACGRTLCLRCSYKEGCMCSDRSSGMVSSWF